MSKKSKTSVWLPPQFPVQGRLPQRVEQVQRNLWLRHKPERDHQDSLCLVAGYRLPPPCSRTLHISLFFDGTGNNLNNDLFESAVPHPTNIARLFRATIGAGHVGGTAHRSGRANGLTDAAGTANGDYYKYYMPGVGTPFPEVVAQLGQRLLQNSCKDLRVATYYLWARLHTDGEPGLADGLNLLAALASALHQALTLKVQALYVRMPGEAERQTLEGHFKPKGFADDDRLWPKGDSAFSGYQLLLEYFTFREKFMFVTLCGLESLSLPLGATWFELDVVLCEAWSHAFTPNEEHIRLHAVPVINLFPLDADPLNLDPLQNEYLLRPMRLQDGHTEIYSVDRVSGSKNSVRQDYVPFSSFRHKGGMLRDEAPERYFHTRLRQGANGLHDTWLILGGEGFDKDVLLKRKSLSLRLTGTNGQLPRKALRSTLLDAAAQSTQAGLQVRNLTSPTLPCYPPNRDRFHWRVLSHLGSNFLPMLNSAEVLRGTLALYEWTGSETNRRRLEAIVEVKHHLIQRFEKGFLLRGVDIEVTLDSNGFSGEGDICLFGEMLSRFFALYADIHLCTQLTLILQPTGRCLRWSEHHSQRIPG
ncbi:type VI secretion system baseplate subunit TssF [Pseudomonas putida]|uniref:type VI secretion system baseplate subunit TssF n=1 Tax=Pseudomonas putida TaxID=303 RepID=UPI000B0DE612|nr:type VI secretion system baseplate subunit TssF [Pseudomonas putida]